MSIGITIENKRRIQQLGHLFPTIFEVLQTIFTVIGFEPL